ncbi:MAG: hypothetical protein Kow0031_17900 [Anaerolineae bacterium]
MFFDRLIKLALLAVLVLAAYPLLPTPYSPAPAHAQEEPNYDLINNIAEKMNCPTCTGINLADCRTQTCAQWKDQIKDLVDQGMSEEEVLDYFVTQYGTQVLQEPPKSGFTLTLWVLPVAMILLGGILLFFTMRNWAGQKTEPAAVSAQPATPAPAAANGTGSASSAAPDDYLSQVEKDLGLD